MENYTRNPKYKKFFILIFFFFFIIPHGKSSSIRAEQKMLVFSTWEGFEVDKCASIWLIKRFVAKDAVIKLFPKGSTIQEGIPFDTPDAKLRRYHNMSTFESILKQYNLSDSRLVFFGKIIHDIEVNIWEKKVFDETLIVQDAVNKIIQNSENNEEVIKKCLEIFDLMYKNRNK